MTSQTDNIPTLWQLIKRFCLLHPNITYCIAAAIISITIALAATAIKGGA